MSNHGTFSGDPQTQWVVNAAGPDRDMLLTEDFWFVDPAGRNWSAPKCSSINGASIPRALWSLVGSPYTDDYRRASVVHDVACNTPGIVRKDADVMFYHACRAGGCGPVQSRILYVGVRIGAWASSKFTMQSLSREAFLFNFQTAPSPETAFMTGKLIEIARDMEFVSEEPTIDELDAIIEQHLLV